MSAPLQNIGAIQSRRMNSHAHPISQSAPVECLPPAHQFPQLRHKM